MSTKSNINQTYIIESYSSGSSSNRFVTGGTFDYLTETLILTNNDNTNVIISGLTDNYTTGATVIGSSVYFHRNDQLSAYTFDLLSATNTYSTGVTFNNNQLTITRNDGFNLSTNINSFTALTITNGLTANTINTTSISATTFYGDGSNLTGVAANGASFTGVNYTNNTLIFKNASGGTVSVSGISSQDTYVTGGTYNGTLLTLTNNTGGTVIITGITSGSSTPSIFITGGTPNNDNKTYTFTNNTGGTIIVQGLIDVTITSGVYNSGNLILFNSTGGSITVTGITASTDDLPEGTNNKYSTNSRVLNYVLTGLTAAASRVLPDAADSIITAWGKVLKYLTDLGTAAFLNVGTTAGTVAAGNDVRIKGYTITNYSIASNPADATTYYLGSIGTLPLTSAGLGSAARRKYINQAGTITSCQVYIINGGTDGSTENATLSCRINDTTDYLISNAIQFNNTGNGKVYNITGLSIPITAGDYQVSKLLTPTWATNPTTMHIEISYYVV